MSAYDIFLFSFYKALEIVCHNGGSSFHGFFRVKSYMGRKDGVRGGKEGIVFGKGRLYIEYINAGTGDFTFFQCFCQGFIVDDASSGGVNQNSIFFHEGQFVFVNEVLCIFGKGQVDGYDIACLKEGVKVGVGDIVMAVGTVIADDFGAEGFSQICGAVSDGAGADDAYCAVFDFNSPKAGACFPWAAASLPSASFR